MNKSVHRNNTTTPVKKTVKFETSDESQSSVTSYSSQSQVDQEQVQPPPLQNNQSKKQENQKANNKKMSPKEIKLENKAKKAQMKKELKGMKKEEKKQWCKMFRNKSVQREKVNKKVNPELETPIEPQKVQEERKGLHQKKKPSDKVQKELSKKTERKQSQNQQNNDAPRSLTSAQQSKPTRDDDDMMQNQDDRSNLRSQSVNDQDKKQATQNIEKENLRSDNNRNVVNRNQQNDSDGESNELMSRENEFDPQQDEIQKLALLKQSKSGDALNMSPLLRPNIKQEPYTIRDPQRAKPKKNGFLSSMNCCCKPKDDEDGSFKYKQRPQSKAKVSDPYARRASKSPRPDTRSTALITYKEDETPDQSNELAVNPFAQSKKDDTRLSPNMGNQVRSEQETEDQQPKITKINLKAKPQFATEPPSTFEEQETKDTKRKAKKNKGPKKKHSKAELAQTARSTDPQKSPDPHQFNLQDQKLNENQTPEQKESQQLTPVRKLNATLSSNLAKNNMKSKADQKVSKSPQDGARPFITPRSTVEDATSQKPNQQLQAQLDNQSSQQSNDDNSNNEALNLQSPDSMAAIVQKPQPNAAVNGRRDSKDSQRNSKLKTSKSTPTVPASKADKKSNKFSVFGSKKKTKKEEKQLEKQVPKVNIEKKQEVKQESQLEQAAIIVKEPKQPEPIKEKDIKTQQNQHLNQSQQNLMVKPDEVSTFNRQKSERMVSQSSQDRLSIPKKNKLSYQQSESDSQFQSQMSDMNNDQELDMRNTSQILTHKQGSKNPFQQKRQNNESYDNDPSPIILKNQQVNKPEDNKFKKKKTGFFGKKDKPTKDEVHHSQVSLNLGIKNQDAKQVKLQEKTEPASKISGVEGSLDYEQLDAITQSPQTMQLYSKNAYSPFPSQLQSKQSKMSKRQLQRQEETMDSQQTSVLTSNVGDVSKGKRQNKQHVKETDSHYSIDSSEQGLLILHQKINQNYKLDFGYQMGDEQSSSAAQTPMGTPDPYQKKINNQKIQQDARRDIAEAKNKENRNPVIKNDTSALNNKLQKNKDLKIESNIQQKDKKSPRKVFFFGNKKNSNQSESSPDTISPKKVKKGKKNQRQISEVLEEYDNEQEPEFLQQMRDSQHIKQEKKNSLRQVQPKKTKVIIEQYDESDYFASSKGGETHERVGYMAYTPSDIMDDTLDRSPDTIEQSADQSREKRGLYIPKAESGQRVYPETMDSKRKQELMQRDKRQRDQQRNDKLRDRREGKKGQNDQGQNHKYILQNRIEEEEIGSRSSQFDSDQSQSQSQSQQRSRSYSQSDSQVSDESNNSIEMIYQNQRASRDPIGKKTMMVNKQPNKNTSMMMPTYRNETNLLDNTQSSIHSGSKQPHGLQGQMSNNARDQQNYQFDQARFNRNSRDGGSDGRSQYDENNHQRRKTVNQDNYQQPMGQPNLQRNISAEQVGMMRHHQISNVGKIGSGERGAQQSSQGRGERYGSYGSGGDRNRYESGDGGRYTSGENKQYAQGDQGYYDQRQQQSQPAMSQQDYRYNKPPRQQQQQLPKTPSGADALHKMLAQESQHVNMQHNRYLVEHDKQMEVARQVELDRQRQMQMEQEQLQRQQQEKEWQIQQQLLKKQRQKEMDKKNKKKGFFSKKSSKQNVYEEENQPEFQVQGQNSNGRRYPSNQVVAENSQVYQNGRFCSPCRSTNQPPQYNQKSGIPRPQRNYNQEEQNNFSDSDDQNRNAQQSYDRRQQEERYGDRSPYRQPQPDTYDQQMGGPQDRQYKLNKKERDSRKKQVASPGSKAKLFSRKKK